MPPARIERVHGSGQRLGVAPVTVGGCLWLGLCLLVPYNRVSAFVSRQTSSGDGHGYNTEHTGNHEVYQRAHIFL